MNTMVLVHFSYRKRKYFPVVCLTVIFENMYIKDFVIFSIIGEEEQDA